MRVALWFRARANGLFPNEQQTRPELEYVSIRTHSLDLKLCDTAPQQSKLYRALRPLSAQSESAMVTHLDLLETGEKLC